VCLDDDIFDECNLLYTQNSRMPQALFENNFVGLGTKDASTLK
jgi:hypothetical protein